MSTPLDFSKPLWQVHLIEQPTGGAVLMFRLHHCVADGIALVRLLLSLTNDDATDSGCKERIRFHGEGGLNPFSQLTDTLAGTVDITQKLAKDVLNGARKLWKDPATFVDWLSLSTRSGQAITNLLLMPPDPETALKGSLGVIKKAAWSGPIPLQKIKRISRAQCGTVNDILLSAVSGALRRYLEQRDQPVDSIDVRAVVPIYLGSLRGEIRLGNHFGLVFLPLPISIVDPCQRLKELKQRMDAIKSSPEPSITYTFLSFVGMMPQDIQKRFINLFGSKATAVMTNVPGPRKPIYLLGREVKTLMFWVPQSGRLALGVSIFSYSGNVYLGVAVDAILVPEPEQLIKVFHDEIDALLRSINDSKEPISSV